MTGTEFFGSRRRRVWVGLLTAMCILFGAAAAAQGKCPAEKIWDIKALKKTPQTWPAEGYDVPGLKAIFYQAMPFEGKATRVFAWVGLPDDVKPGRKVPGMVLVHGGAGTAFDQWVRLWNQRGYAAIAMNLDGQCPVSRHGDDPKKFPPSEKHPWSGPAGFGEIRPVGPDIGDYWMYHAVADVILADSLLRSLPEVDPDKIGVTGISWGGVITTIAAAVDHRFRFAIPVYGCGFINESPVWAPAFAELGKPAGDRWLRLWDPTQYLSDVDAPVLWITGANDPFFILPIHSKTYNLCPTPKTLSVRVKFVHDYVSGWGRPEIYAFADRMTQRKAPPLLKITHRGRDGDTAWVQCKPVDQLRTAELIFTDQNYQGATITWQSRIAVINAKTHRIEAEVPAQAKAFFFNLTDRRDLTVSTPLTLIGSIGFENILADPK